MKFKLKTTGSYYRESQKVELETLGFKFREAKTLYPEKPFLMDGKIEPEIEFNSLEELVAFTEKWDELIINGNEIEIYDSYRE